MQILSDTSIQNSRLGSLHSQRYVKPEERDNAIFPPLHIITALLRTSAVSNRLTVDIEQNLVEVLGLVKKRINPGRNLAEENSSAEDIAQKIEALINDNESNQAPIASLKLKKALKETRDARMCMAYSME